MTETTDISDPAGHPLPVPGTALLVDVEHNIAQRHAKGNDVLLVPAPSADPEDPLNWTPRRKFLSMTCVLVYCLALTLCASTLNAIIVPFSEVSGISVGTVNQGAGYTFLLAGWGLLFWQPFALRYGKRLTYILSVAATVACTIWAPYVKTNPQWLANRIILGFVNAPIEALPEVSVTDIYFTHERGTYMSLYAIFLAGGMYVGPMMYGFIADRQSWRWVFYWPTIFGGIAIIFLFFFMEETSYNRKHTLVGQPLSHKEEDLIIDEKDRSELGKSPNTNEHGACETDSPVAFPKKTALQKLSLWQPLKGQNLTTRFIRTFQYALWPVVLYCGFIYGSYLIWFNVMNATASVVLSGAPYNFRPSMVGLSYASPLVGTLLAALYTGRFSDWLTIRLARRNNGVMEAEQRLWPFLLCVLVIPASLILWGVGAAHGIHWFGLIVAMCGLGFINAVGITLSVNYLIDSYHHISGDALSTVIIIRNSMAFGLGYAITPWFENMGFQGCFLVAAFVGMAVAASFLIMVRYGKQLRARSTEAYWKLVESDINSSQ